MKLHAIRKNFLSRILKQHVEMPFQITPDAEQHLNASQVSRPDDLVISAALGYGSTHIIPFLHSLRKVYNGRIILIIFAAQREDYKHLEERYRTEFFVINEKPDGPPHTERYFYYQAILSSEKSIKRVFLTDSRDVLFQDDPSNKSNRIYIFSPSRRKSRIANATLYGS